MKVRWPLLLIALFLLFGCAAEGEEGVRKSPLGFRTPSECDRLYDESQIMQCYHRAAISEAYIDCKKGEECQSAAQICEEIWDTFQGDPRSTDDLRRKAELTRNTCYHDLAKILAYPDYCDEIELQDDLDTGLFGAEVTQDMCRKEAEARARIAPEHLWEPNSGSICTIIFVLPALLVATVLLPKRP